MYQVPVEVKQNKRLFYAMRWILDSVRTKKGKQGLDFCLRKGTNQAFN
ncbi:MAG: hypothetical protein EOM23_10780 [Candidatus Moranbacteria bacterium]|nr:hypothetical protein [Candidatus Moranbacteria bacterium]